MEINCDNQGAIALPNDNKFHSQMEHINVWYHFIHKAVEDAKLSVKYIPTDKNPTNIFTKALPKVKFQHFVELLGLHLLDSKAGSGKMRK